MEIVLCKINNIYIYKIDIALIPKKKLRRTKGGAKYFGVFRVKNHDFTPRNHIFSNFRGARAPGAPPLDPPLDCVIRFWDCSYWVVLFSQGLFLLGGIVFSGIVPIGWYCFLRDCSYWVVLFSPFNTILY